MVAVVTTVASLAVLVAGGAAFGAYRYEVSRTAQILPGVRIAGIDVGGMTRREAAQAVRAAVDEELAEPLVVTVGDHRSRVSPAELGRRAAVGDAVHQALSLNATLSTFDRFWHRVNDESVGVEIDVEYRTGGRAIEQLAAELADEVFEPWTNASIGITKDANDIVFHRSSAGRKLPVDEAAATIRSALEAGERRIEIETVKLAPKIATKELGRTIVVRVDRNVLELYDGFEVIGTWDVATAKPGWITPTGVWEIWDKRVNPTWYNPALDSWGASLPAVVPGGPTAPMGTRAIYIDAPGLIRVHGTPAPESIGTYASHGCIRMRNEEVEELFEMIDVGEHVVIVGHRPGGAQEGDTPAEFDI
ncbi:MAG TPA: L,D-transpeptidase family protein [Actinomycetota bacterium]|nr:L,D-transpeptidase family protein [Actinomycetota bacterium]